MTNAFPASSASLGDTDCTLKASLIWPGKLEISKPHADRLAQLLDDEEQPRLPTSWALGTRALLALRTGDAEAAVDYVAESEQLGPIDLARPFIQAVRAMAHMELNHTGEAKAALAKAKQLITSLKEDPVKKDQHDTLIAEILIREAEAKINGKNDSTNGS